MKKAKRPRTAAHVDEIIPDVIPLVKEAHEAGLLKDVVSRSYVSDVINGRREPGPTLLAAIGVVKQCVYVRRRQA